MRILLTIITFLQISIAYTQTIDGYRNFTIDDGISDNQVSCILQDRDDFTWVGTLNGLNWFDGRHWKLYNHQNSALRNSQIRRLASTPDHKLVAATRYGLAEIDHATGIMKHIEIPGQPGIENWTNDVQHLEIPGTNERILGTLTGVYVYDSNWNRITAIEGNFDAGRRGAKRIYFCLNIAAFTNGDALLATTEGYHIYYHHQARIVPVDQDSSAPYAFLRKFLAEHQRAYVFDINAADQLFFFDQFSRDEMLYVLDQAGKKLKKWYFPFDPTYYIRWDARFEFPAAGRARINSARGGFFECEYNTNTLELTRPVSRKMTAIVPTLTFEDRMGRNWLGTQTGLLMQEGYQRFFEQYALHSSQQDSLFRGVNNILRSGQYYWTSVYSRSGGVQVFDSTFRHIKTIHPTSGTAPPAYVFRVIPWNSDSLLVSTGNGMFMFHRFNFGYKPVEQTDLLKAAGKGFIPLYFFESADGSLWLSGGRFGGLLVYDPLRKTAKRFAAGTGPRDFPLGHAAGFQQDNKGNIWMINVTNGLTKWNARTGLFDTVVTKINQGNNPSQQISGFAIDAQQRHWYFVNQAGLFSREKSGGPITQVLQVNDGAISDALSLFYTDNHQLWIYLSNGLMVYDIQSGRSRYFSYGKITGNAVPWALQLDIDQKNGRLYLGCLNTILEIKSLAVFFPGEENPLLFRGMTLPGSRKRLNFSSIVPLNPDENNISIDFAMVDYDQLVIPHFEYRLNHNGDAGNWIVVDAQNSLHFHNLAKGNYDLQVRKMGLKEVQPNSLAAVSFLVLPEFHETNLFKLLLVLLIMAVMYVFYRARIQQLVRENLIRKRISSDLHDDLGARITSLALLGEILDKNVNDSPQRSRYVQKMKEELSLASESLDDIVWNEKTTDESAAELVSRMRRFAADLMEPTTIHLQFRSDTFSNRQKLNREKRRDIFLAYKELLNNVLKHSGADRLQIDIHSSGNRFNLLVADNGKGFPADQKTDRNGIRSIHHRVEKWKGSVNFEQHFDGGVQVRLTIPFDRASLKWTRSD
ncbi:ATP-binding protein [Flavihumibacter stibioxidans]|uniref:histidine kinase n=1 Tax=Flavihumibacter stibioxidans TaxID=1834163 RepID=A0ABR7MA10_9BACT|nr:ATP-binding protein [Flavihumibacter stibioxidans]MBC6491364.1 hypothetical protein [Flavihumibacter stibioxidans]